MINDYMIKSMLFHQADVTFYTTKDKINEHLHFDNATLPVLLLNGAAFPGECQRSGTSEQQGPRQSSTDAHQGKDASFTGPQRSQEPPSPSITLK